MLLSPYPACDIQRNCFEAFLFELPGEGGKDASMVVCAIVVFGSIQ